MKSFQLFISLVVLLVILAISVTYFFAKSNAKNNLQTDLKSQIIQVINKLQITLERHSYLPSKLSTDKEIISFLSTPISSAKYQKLQSNINLSLELSNNISGSANIFILGSDGIAVSSSNWAEKDTYIDKDFSSQPYFEQASQNVLGRHFSSQLHSGERYYYFARSVLYNKKVIGIVVVQVSLSDIVFNWTVANIDFAITDKSGEVFLTTNSEWGKKSFLSQLSSAQQSRSLETAAFDEVEIHEKKYLMLSERMEIAGWDVRVLSKYSIVQKDITRIMSVAIILILLLMALAGLILKVQRQRTEFQKQATEELENKVIERTQALKKSQEELIQAAKMAALGQLSIGITHEINNPLTAIRAYADNANQFLQKDRLDMVGANLNEITKLTESIESITGQLKSFSRKSKGQLRPVNLNLTVKNAISIVHSKIVSSGTEINYVPHDIKQMVQADEVWLSQVLVNLISNAISATNKQEQRKVWIDIKENVINEVHHYRIEISDNGTGIEESNLPRIFEPFFTTKPMKKGLGLGLSISFNLVKDMNGTLDARNRSAGGALFTLCLPSVINTTE